MKIWSGQEEVWEGCKSPGEVHLLLLFWRSLQVKEETRPSWKAVGSKHENHGFFKLLSCSVLPIIFTLGNFRCCLFLGKSFSDASFRQTVVGQGFSLFGCFWVWSFFLFLVDHLFIQITQSATNDKLMAPQIVFPYLSMLIKGSRFFCVLSYSARPTAKVNSKNVRVILLDLNQEVVTSIQYV